MKKLTNVWKKVSPAVRVLVGAALLAWLFHFTDLSTLKQTAAAATANCWWLTAGLVFTFLGIFASAVRWKYVLAAQQIHFTMTQTFLSVFIGQFFNAFMLGSCGGDMVRAYYAVKQAPAKRTEAAATIFIDRAVGLFAMILFCCLMIPVRINMFLDNDGPRYAGVLMLIFMAAAIVGILVLFQKNVFDHFPFFRRIEEMPTIGNLVRRSYEAFYLYRGHHRVLAIAVVLSLANLFMLTLACWCYGQALSLRVAVLDYFVLFPLINVLQAVPLTPGSLGVREGLFVSLFAAVLVGPSPAIVLSLLVYGGGVFWSVFGGILYLFSPLVRTEMVAGARPPDENAAS